MEKPASAALVVAVLLAMGGTATAGPRVLLAPVYGEADVADEATAVQLLVRSAFADDPTAIADVVGRRPTLDNAASFLTTADSQHMAMIEVDRLGPTLVATVQIIDRNGAIAGKLATQAGDGGVTELATDIVREIGRVTGVPVTDLPYLSTGQLRPFARAHQLATADKRDEAARALEGADPVIALRVSAAGAVATALWKDEKLDRQARLIACSVACTARDIMALTENDRSAAARSARALAQVSLSDAAAAALELSGLPDAADTAFARAAIAELRQDIKARDAAIADLVNAPDVDKAATAWIAKLPPGTLAPGLEGGVVRLGEQASSGRLSAVIGLRAIEACDGSGGAAPAGSAGTGSAGGPGSDGSATAVDDASSTVCPGLGGMRLDRPLAMISVTELDRRERARLKPIVAKATGTDAMRLIAELAFVEGDHETAQAALAKLKRSTDPRAAMYRGRIAWMLGDLALAAEELGNAGATLEQARVQLAKGDAGAAGKTAGDDDMSRIVAVSRAEIALAESRPGDAVKQLRAAEMLAPGDRDTQVRLANALELSGDVQAAKAVRARLLDLAEPRGFVKKDPVATGSGSGSAAVKDDDPDAKVSAARLSVRATLRDLLATFPPAALNGNALVLAPIGEAPSSWALREVDPEPLVRELEIVLKTAHQAHVAARAPRLPDRPSAGELSAVAQQYGGGGVLAFSVNVDGAVRLVVFDSATQSAFEQHGTIDVDALDMVHWNLRWLLIPLGIGGVLIGLVLLAVLRGSGWIEVKVIRDPQGKDEVLCLELQKTKRRWTIRDLEAFREATTAAGAKVGRRTARLVGELTKFKVPPGHWYVHLYGVYDRPGGPRTCDEEHTAEITLERGSRETVAIDLLPRTAELRIRVHDENPRGVMLWVDDGPKSYTDAKGEALMYSPMGEHVLHIEAKGVRLERQLSFKVPVTENIDIDLEGIGTSSPSRPGMSKSGMSKSGMRTPSSPNVSRSGMRTPSSPNVSRSGMSSMPGRARPSATSPGATAAAMSRPGMSSPGMKTPPPETAASESAGSSMPRLEIPADQSLGGGQPMSVAKIAASATMPSMVGLSVSEQAKASPRARGSIVPPAATSPRPVGGINVHAADTVAGLPDLLCGRYRIKQTLGRGAMGVVYRARDEHLEREVAIKVLASDLRHHPDALRFFIEEAKALAQLNHPNIVSVFDQTTDGDETYLVMEFVDGRTLDSLLEEKGKLPLHTSLALIDQLCAGLAYVHARRVIHRDIKPANIFVSRDRIVKLGDFGLARVMHELSIRRTEIRGTPMYMAPEQITGENVTNRADLYAVGCTLFELVTGRPPFTDGEILYHHLHTAPPKPSQFEPSLSKEFDQLVADCIVKDAEKRLESATAIRERIRALGIASQSSPSIKVLGR